MFMEFLPPALAAAICMTMLGYARSRARGENEVRVRQLEESAQLLAIHAQTLGDFLSDEAAPDILKRVLIDCSDAMTNQEVVLKFAEWLSSRPIKSVQLDELSDHKEIMTALSSLKDKAPLLAADFGVATLTVVVGSIMRWPKSAALFERIGTRMAASSRGDIGLAVAVASFRGGVTLHSSGHNHAVA